MNQQPHIAFLITRSDTIGGAHVHVRDLSCALLDEGYAVTVLTGGEGPFTEDLAKRKIPYRSLKHLVRSICPLYDWAGLHEIQTILASLQPDLVSTHSSKAGLLGRVAAHRLGIPVLFTAHGWSFTNGVPALRAICYRYIEQMTSPFTDRIITVSENDRQLALRYHLASPETVVTIHNGMPDIPSHLHADPEFQPSRLIMVARFEEQKDHTTLFSALARIQDRRWELNLIGDGPLQQHYRQLAGRLGLAQRIRFLGRRSDVAEWLAASQLFVLSTNWEGFPRSILEAMRAGLPVVTSDVGGSREAVRDGETGYLVPRRNVDMLCDRLTRLIDDPRRRKQMGQAARAFYLSHFTFARMLDDNLRIYHSLIRRFAEREPVAV